MTQLPGLVFGGSLMLALLGAAAAAFAGRPRDAASALAASMLGVGGVCLALGSDFIGLLVITLLGAAVPSLLLAALLLAPAGEPDIRTGTARGRLVALGTVAGFAALGWMVAVEAWLPAGGQNQHAIEWLGSRLLTDHLLTLELIVLLPSLAGLGAVALLRGRRSRERRHPA